MSSESSYDVIVVGAGPAGSASASLFAEQGRRVLLVDAARFPRSKPCAEYVSPGGVAILQRLGALARIEAAGTFRWLRGMQLRAPNGGRHLIEYSADDGRQKQGLSVPRLVMDAALLEVARARGVEVREGFRVRDVWRADGRVRGVNGPQGERVAAELVIGADGLHSVVARALKARRPAPWPRRLGLVSHWANVDWPEDFGCLLVGPRGYVGIAPLDHAGQVSIGLVRGMPRGRQGASAAALEAGLAEYPDLRGRLRQGRLAGPVQGVGPLATRVRASAGPGYRLVGDAAGFFDPFTGEGIFRALRSAELVAACPDAYARARTRAFSTRARLVALIQVFVQTPRLMDFAVQRLQRRPHVAQELGNVLGDLAPARLDLAWRLLGP
ncbi:MAG TPA: NAD(P)/FAD-dependent oxidoreductase [Chloroflexota bacterium]|nr:NAD(P)/FAD-dependent oxidoreductase [Chloroflexota bacterium]